MVNIGNSTKLFAGVGLAFPRLGNVRLGFCLLRRGSSGGSRSIMYSIFILFLFLPSILHAQKVYSLETQRAFLPKKEVKYKLPIYRFSESDSLILSPNNYYINLFENYSVYPIMDTTYTFIRFFDDGRVFFSFPYYSSPSEIELKDFKYGRFGRYIVKNRKIKVELYMDKQDGVMYMHAYPILTGIQFYKATGRSLGSFLKVSRFLEGGFYKKY